MVLPFNQVKNLPGLRVSPIGLVPQHNRRPRTIVDYSYSGVNLDTLKLAPKEAMQFGRTLTRLLHKIVQADPCHGPVKLIKVDVADGFYRIHLSPHQLPALGVAFPQGPNGVDLVAFPLALPMGWVESLPYFCMATESITDLANIRLKQDLPVANHRLSSLADSSPTPEELEAPTQGPPRIFQAQPTPHARTRACKPPVRHVNVYVNDFIALAQGSTQACQKVRDHLLTSMDQVFRPALTSEGQARQEPISVKKLAKGDTCWATRKEIFGWEINTVAETIQLPTWRLKQLHALLKDYPRTKRRVAVKKW
jgi:hypothetical protein